MKINSHILSLPPHISTSWVHVVGLYTKGTTLFIILTAGTTVAISNLDSTIIDAIFRAHAEYIETNGSSPKIQIPNPLSTAGHGDAPIQLGIASLDGLGSAMQHMQHNPDFANAPDLPKEMLEKISAIARIVAPEELSSLPEAQLNCNCPHCQIARAIGGHHQKEVVENVEVEAAVSPDDLSFQQWDILQTGQNLFQVTNKLELSEVYHVHLGDPIGCTCGQPGCEHIPAVLKT
jgi:hypothetical protein